MASFELMLSNQLDFHQNSLCVTSRCSVKAYIHECLCLGSCAAAMRPYVEAFGKKLCATLGVIPDPDNARYFPTLDKIRRTCAKEIRSMRLHQVSMREGRGVSRFGLLG